MIITPGFMKKESYGEMKARLHDQSIAEKQRKEKEAFEKARLKRKKKKK